MRALATDSPGAVPGALYYTVTEHSFAFEPIPSFISQLSDQQRMSFLIGTLQLEVALPSQRLLYAWGLCPRAGWQPGRVPEPTRTRGSVFAVDEVLLPGVSLTVAKVGEWPIVWDEKSGWIRLGEPGTAANVEIADGVVVALSESVVAGLWLRPSMRQS